MIHLPASVRVYLCLTPCDMRTSFDSLHALVREHLELDALRRPSVRLYEPPERPGQDFVLGPRWIRGVEQLTIFTLHLSQFQADILEARLQICRSIH